MCKSSQKKMKKIEYLYSHTVTENFMGAAIITFDPFVRRHPGSLSLFAETSSNAMSEEEGVTKWADLVTQEN